MQGHVQTSHARRNPCAPETEPNDPVSRTALTRTNCGSLFSIWSFGWLLSWQGSGGWWFGGLVGQLVVGGGFVGGLQVGWCSGPTIFSCMVQTIGLDFFRQLAVGNWCSAFFSMHGAFAGRLCIFCVLELLVSPERCRKSTRPHPSGS